MREIRNTAVQVQSADRFKGQMNQKFDFFLFQLNFSEMCCTIIPYSRRFFVNRLG